MSDDYLWRQYQALTARVYARESSTLTIAALTTAAALTFLAIVVTLPPPDDLKIYVFGVLFAFAGFFFRELTVLTTDKIQLRKITEMEVKLFPCQDQLPEGDRRGRFLRWFLFRCVMLFPALGLLRYAEKASKGRDIFPFSALRIVQDRVPDLGPFLDFVAYVLLFVVVVAAIFSTLEYFFVDRPRDRIRRDAKA